MRIIVPVAGQVIRGAVLQEATYLDPDKYIAVIAE